MICKLFCQSKSKKSCSDDLDFICNQLALWYERQLVTAANVADTLAGSFENVTRSGLAGTRKKSSSFSYSRLLPWSLDFRSRYGGAIFRAFYGTKASCVHRGFALTHAGTSGHDLRDRKGILTHSRSPPVQFRLNLYAGGNPRPSGTLHHLPYRGFLTAYDCVPRSCVFFTYNLEDKCNI